MFRQGEANAKPRDRRTARRRSGAGAVDSAVPGAITLIMQMIKKEFSHDPR